MTIKSLLLGSAAALVAVSGANAADAIVAPEPEAVEYVKVCDTYGDGYFYIPGTETCLSINGEVRADFLTRNQIGTRPHNHQNEFGYRGRVNFDARTETEYGTLRSYLRIQGTHNSLDAATIDGNGTSGNRSVTHGIGDANVSVDQALIQLGGFSVGYTDSAWVNNTWGLNGIINDGVYGYRQTALIGYEWDQDGISAGLFAEFGDIDSEGTDLAGNQYRTRSWLEPNVVARVKYDGGWGSVWALVGYDNGVNEFAGKLGTEIKLDAITEGAAFKIQGTYDFGGDKNNAAASRSTVFSDGVEWDFMAGYSQPIGDKLAAAVGYYTSDEWKNGNLIGNLTWTPVSGFSIAGEVIYNMTPDAERVDTILRFTRSF